MARIHRQLRADAAIISDKENIGLYSGAITPTMRLNVDGQNGLTTDFRTLNAMTPYVKQDVVCFVLELPRAFGWLPGGHRMARALKTLMETHSEKIEGLDQSLKAEYEEMNMGAMTKFHAFTRSTRENSEPQHTWTEKYGLAIGKLFATWIVMLLADPITKIPGIISLKGAQKYFGTVGQGHRAYTRTPENVAMTCLYIEPDPTGCFPVLSYLCANMMPDNAGDWTSEMDKTAAPSLQQVTVKFTCSQEVGAGVENLAAHVLNVVNKTGLSYFHRRAYIGDTYGDVNAAAESFVRSATTEEHLYGDGVQQLGFMGQAQEIGSTESIDNMHGRVLHQEELVTPTEIPNEQAGRSL